MNGLPLMSKYDLYGKLQRRFHDYSSAISPAGDGSITLTVITHWLYFEQQIKNLDAQYELFGRGFWGYGINRISNGRSLSTNLDVSDIAKLNENNKHHSHSLFNLIIFKIDGDDFIYNTFCFNLMNLKWTSELLQKVSLTHLVNISPKIENQYIFLDLKFDNLELPIGFQIETYISHNQEPPVLSKSYVEYIRKASVGAKSKTQSIEEDFTAIDKTIDEIEQRMRKLIYDEITGNGFPNSYKKVIPQPILGNVEIKIGKHLRDHPGTPADKFKDLASGLQFFDLMEYKSLVSNKTYWTLFEKFFNNAANLDKHCVQLSNLRNALRHSREKSPLVVAEGKASIIWFKGALSLT